MRFYSLLFLVLIFTSFNSSAQRFYLTAFTPQSVTVADGYTTGKTADIHCYENPEEKMGGLPSAHKLHRIIAK